jgi:hypothetical protein
VSRFEQRFRGRRRELEILESGVRIREAGRRATIEHEVRFEDIQGDRVELAVSSRGWAVAAVVASIATLAAGAVHLFAYALPLPALALGPLVTLAAAAAYALVRRRYVGYLCPGGGLFLYDGVPDRASPRVFLDQIEQRRQAYLRERKLRDVLASAPVLDEKALRQLHRAGLIDDHEMAHLKARLGGAGGLLN